MKISLDKTDKSYEFDLSFNSAEEGVCYMILSLISLISVIIISAKLLFR